MERKRLPTEHHSSHRHNFALGIMAQEMGTLEGGIEPGPRQGAAHDRPETLAVSESPGGGAHPDKDLPRRARWSPVAEVGNERGANLLRQRKAIIAGSLPPDPECSGVPS